MRVLITGATGLLGSHIVDACINQKDKIKVLVRKTSNIEYLKTLPDIEFVYGSLSEPEAIIDAAKDVDIVYHSAARVSDWGSRQQFLDANYVGTKYVVEACKKNKVKRLVYISSPSVVFDYKDEIMIDESCPYPKTFANHYSETKAIAEQFVVSSHEKGGLETVVIRPHAIWGPRDKTGPLPRILAKIKSGSFKNLSMGKEVFIDMCYAVNAAEACISAAVSSRAGGKVYFISNDDPVNIWEFLDTVSDTFGIRKIKESLNPQKIMPLVRLNEFIWRIPFLAKNYQPPITRYAIGVLTYSTTYNLTAAKNDLSYSPKIDTEKGIQLFKEWVDNNGGIEEYLKDL